MFFITRPTQEPQRFWTSRYLNLRLFGPFVWVHTLPDPRFRFRPRRDRHGAFVHFGPPPPPNFEMGNLQSQIPIKPSFFVVLYPSAAPAFVIAWGSNLQPSTSVACKFCMYSNQLCSSHNFHRGSKHSTAGFLVRF